MVMDSAAPLSSSSPARVPDGPAAQPRRAGTDPSAPPSEPGAARSVAATGDSTLWDLLTPEERVVLQRHAGLGSLTYRPNGRPAADLSVPTGRRIDIRG
jgi:hypothetical protein